MKITRIPKSWQKITLQTILWVFALVGIVWASVISPNLRQDFVSREEFENQTNLIREEKRLLESKIDRNYQELNENIKQILTILGQKN